MLAASYTDGFTTSVGFLLRSVEEPEIKAQRPVEIKDPMTSDVLVMGGGATGQLAAAYMRLLPEPESGRGRGPHKNRPIVGESFVELTVDFLLELGLGAYLIEKHYPKYGLTYYFKLDIDHPVDRTYIVDEASTVPRLLSFQVNRFTLDREVRYRRSMAL